MSKKIKMPELKAEMPKAKKSSVNSVADALNLFTAGFSKKDVKSALNLTDNQIHHIYYNVFKENKPKGKVGRPKKVVDADVKIKTKKIGRPKKAVVELPPVPPAPPKRKKGRPKKVQFTPLTLEEHFFGIKRKKKPNKKMAENRKRKSDDRKEFIELHDYNPLDDAKEYDSPPNPPFGWDDKPLDAYTKKTVIVGAEKDEIALEFLNSQVISLKKQNQKLLEINNKHVLELSKLRVEKNNNLEGELFEELDSLRNQHANQKLTINELQGVIATLTQEIKDLKEQDVTSDELSKKQFEKSMGKKVLNFFISFMLGLIAAILFMIALA
jgi:hypothetical protein